MSVRVLLIDKTWAEIEPRLTAIKRKAGSPPELSSRRLIEAVLCLACTGLPWRDLPVECGHWDAVYHSCRQWEARGIRRQPWTCLQAESCEAPTLVFIDSTSVRLHQHAVGTRGKKAGKRHRLWAALGRAFRLTSMAAASMTRPAPLES
jgi:transposase